MTFLVSFLALQTNVQSSLSHVEQETKINRLNDKAMARWRSVINDITAISGRTCMEEQGAFVSTFVFRDPVGEKSPNSLKSNINNPLHTYMLEKFEKRLAIKIHASKTPI